MEYLAALMVLLLAALGAAVPAYWGAKKLALAGALAMLAVMLAPGLALWLVPETDLEWLFMLLASPLWLAIVTIGWLSGRSARARGSGRGLKWLIGTILTFAALCAASYVWLEVKGRWDQQLAWRIEQEQRLARAEAEARRCIAELARRNPEADVAADIARGDATPIGRTYLPHDPAILMTSYPEACREVPDGQRYESTGKWFTGTAGGFSFEREPPSADACDRAGQEYIRRYNRQMVALAQAAVARFCRRVGGEFGK